MKLFLSFLVVLVAFDISSGTPQGKIQSTCNLSMIDEWLLVLSEDDFPELSYEEQRNMLGNLSISNLEEFMSV